MAQEYIRKIQQSKGSYILTLPRSAMKQFGWRAQQKVIVTTHGTGFLIRDWKPRSKQ